MIPKKPRSYTRKKNETKLRVFEAFAGYGGASFALKRSCIPFEVIGYSENDKFASELYDFNHPGIQNYGDITKINPHDLPDFDLFTGGFPCQPFSSVGLGKGEQDIRGSLFYDIIRICEYKQPKHILLENVKGLATNRHGQTYNTILAKLKDIGYFVRPTIMNSKDYGVPQNRERVWIYGCRDELPEDYSIAPSKTGLCMFFKDLLDKNPDPSLYKNDTQVDRLKSFYGLDFAVPEPSCVDLYNRNIRSDGISITILEPHHNKLRIAHPPKSGRLQVRKMSVAEHFRFMGFLDGEIKFPNQSYQQLCKRASNGWDINLVAKIFSTIFK